MMDGTTNENEMDNSAFISYCETHAESERALFSGKDVKRIYKLAGSPEKYGNPQEVERISDDFFMSLKRTMKELCLLARENLK